MPPYHSLYHECFQAPKNKTEPTDFMAFIEAIYHFDDVELLGANRGYLHGEKAGAPCVIFKAPISQIKRINVVLMTLNAQGLHYHWTLTGKLDGLNQLFFRLSSPALDEAANANNAATLFHMGWHRLRIDSDIKRLTAYMNSMLPC